MAIEFKDGKYVDPQTGRVTLDPTVYKDWQIAEEAEKALPSVDYFREKTGKRPSVRINNPDVLLNIHIAQTTCTLSLDSSGESLHRRGYRQEAVEAHERGLFKTGAAC